MSELAERIKNYLSNGGLFNPELMEHDKVRELLQDCSKSDFLLAEALEHIKKAISWMEYAQNVIPLSTVLQSGGFGGCIGELKTILTKADKGGER